MSRETTFSGANEDRKNIMFFFSDYDHEQDWQRYSVDLYLAESADHFFFIFFFL